MIFPIDKQRDIEKERNNTNVSNFYLNFKIKILNSNLLINEKKIIQNEYNINFLYFNRIVISKFNFASYALLKKEEDYEKKNWSTKNKLFINFRMM